MVGQGMGAWTLASFAPQGLTGMNVWIVLGVLALVLLGLSLMLMLVTRYKRCPSNRVLDRRGRPPVAPTSGLDDVSL